MLQQTYMLFAESILLAQATVADIGPAISMVGSLGISIWYVYYTTTVAIPRLLDSHRAERLELLTAHRVERIELQERFDKALVDIRAEFDTDVQALLAELKESRLQLTQWLTDRRAGNRS